MTITICDPRRYAKSPYLCPMKEGIRLIRFDWAIKRLLRDKANFVVLEGFLSVLLNEKVTINRILSSQANKEDENDKYNDVDILVENSIGELIIVEVQNTKEHDYFHRILYGASKVITEYIQEGDAYKKVRKVISITVAYFDLGQGEDYVYYGSTIFKGFHKGDILSLSAAQRELYDKTNVSQIYPEYWIIKAGVFDENKVNDKLDEWIYFLKTGEVLEDFTAAGIPEAKKRLDKMNLSPEERKEYEAYIERLRRIASQEETVMDDIKIAIKKDRIETATELKKLGVSTEIIQKATGLTAEVIEAL
jgi:predicted transposase/invertase (TIGR01784 family)